MHKLDGSTQPLNFPKPWITFNNSKQDVYCKCLNKTGFKDTALFGFGGELSHKGNLSINKY